MKADYILQPRKLKASSDIVTAIRKDRKAGASFRALAKKYKLSYSYCYYLCLKLGEKERYLKKMADSSRRYYQANREEVIRKNSEHTKEVRKAKRKILAKKEKRGCYMSRRTNL